MGCGLSRVRLPGHQGEHEEDESDPLLSDLTTTYAGCSCDTTPTSPSSAVCVHCRKRLHNHTYEDEVNCAFKHACEKGTHTLSRNRLMIVGCSGAGKTSVKRSLLHKKFQTAHIPTPGISLGNDCCVERADGVGWKPGRPSFSEMFYSILPDSVPRIHHILVRCFVQVCDFFLSRWRTSGETDTTDDSGSENGQHLPHSVVERVKDMLQSHTIGATRKEQGRHVSLWDFGGELGYYVMHQIFLNPQAVYLLVMDGTQGLGDVVRTLRPNAVSDDDVPRALPQTGGQYLDFWLKSIYTRIVERRNEQVGGPKVIIVVTKADQMSESQIGCYKTALQNHLVGKVYHDLVYGAPIFVNNRNKNDDGIRQLRSSVHDIVTKVCPTGCSIEYPTRWLVLSELIRCRNDKPIMSLGDFVKFAEDTIYNENDAKEFLRMHHVFGDVLYFEEELPSFVITDPQWLVDAISPIFAPEMLRKKPMMYNCDNTLIDLLDRTGDLREALLDELWSRHAEKINKIQLLELMTEFDLILPFPNSENGQKRYIVPSMLRPRTRDVASSNRLPVAPAIGFTFYCDQTNPYLPQGFFPRLVSRCCTSHRKPPWKLIRYPSYDYARFYLTSTGEDNMFISLCMEGDFIKLSAHEVPGATTGVGVSASSGCAAAADHRSDLLTTTNTSIQEHLRHIAQRVFPRLERKLKAVIWCNCPTVDSADSSGTSYIEVGADGHSLHLRGFKELCCDEHEYMIPIHEYKHWFSPSTHTGAGMDDEHDDTSIPIEVMPDPLAEERLKNGRLYPLVHQNRGRVLIVNNMHFPDTLLCTRDGSVHDATHLYNLFTLLGFKVRTEEDLTAAEMRTLMTNEAKRGNHGDAFFLWVLSHGADGLIYGCDGNFVHLQDIIAPFMGDKCPELRAKPKVFMFQTCRGDSSAAYVNTNQEQRTPCKPCTDGPPGDKSDQPQGDLSIQSVHEGADTMLVFATISGFEAYRHPDKGAWFVRAFVKEVCRSAHTKHLEEILEDTDERLQQIELEPYLAGKRKIQALEWHKRSFNRKLYFLPGYYIDA